MTREYSALGGHGAVDLNGQILCTTCILPDTFPGIRFNSDGICNHCTRKEGMTNDNTKEHYKGKFLDLITSIREREPNRTGPEVLMAFSGGKDSTYTMWMLKVVYGLKVIAFTFENGFTSGQAIKNINHVCAGLGITHIMVRQEQEELNRMFGKAATEDLYPTAQLQRASSICTMCSNFFKSFAIRYALENKIPLIAYGWSPGQAPIQAAITQSKPAFVKSSQLLAIKVAVSIAGEQIKQHFIPDDLYSIPEDQWPYNVHPLAYEDYTEEMVLEHIETLGWRLPGDVDTNSTNCLLNAYANEAHLRKYKFHPYVWEIANMVRQKIMTRDEGIEKIYTPQNMKLVDYGEERLQISK